MRINNIQYKVDVVIFYSNKVNRHHQDMFQGILFYMVLIVHAYIHTRIVSVEIIFYRRTYVNKSH